MKSSLKKSSDMSMTQKLGSEIGWWCHASKYKPGGITFSSAWLDLKSMRKTFMQYEYHFLLYPVNDATIRNSKIVLFQLQVNFYACGQG